MRPAVLAVLGSLVLAAALQASPQPPSPPASAPQGQPASQGAPASGQPAAQPPKPAPPPPPPPQEAYTYQPQGRRDPFLNLLGTGNEPRLAGGKRVDGPASMTVGEISVRGVLQSRGALVAMVTGPDGKTYIVHQGDKLADGTIKAITPQGLIVLQDVNDPLSLVKQREVTKLLRALEVAKE